MAQKEFTGFVVLDNKYIPTQEVELIKLLTPGAYMVQQNQRGEVFFEGLNFNHDLILDLPATEFDTVISEFNTFMKPETKAKFDKYGFLYKRSVLLYGIAGGGKTTISNRIAQKVIADNGIVLFSPHPQLLGEAFRIIDCMTPNVRIMVVFEEFDGLIKNHETVLLSLLDGETQRKNVSFIACTNHIDKIPARLKRPGRFSSLIKVGAPSAATREFYLRTKLGNDKDIPMWVEKTNGFTVDHLKELVLAVKCLDLNFDSVIARIRSLGGEAFAPNEEEDESGQQGLRNRYKNLFDDQGEQVELMDDLTEDSEDDY